MCSAFTFPKGFFSSHLYKGKTVKRLKLDPFIAEILVRVSYLKIIYNTMDFLFCLLIIF